MFATIRRYEGVDPARTSEITGKVTETLIPELSKLDGFAGFYLIEAGQRDTDLARPVRATGAGRRVDQVRRAVDHRRAPRQADPERPEGHERQGRCAQRPHGRLHLGRPSSDTTKRGHKSALSR